MLTFVFSDKSTLQLDATLSQSHQAQAEVTAHPVEKGANISDHVRAQAKKLSIEGIISNVPVLSGGEVPTPNRAMSAYQRLQKAMDGGELLDVQTGLRIYKRMALTSLNPKRDATTGHSFWFNADLSEVRTVDSETVSIPKSALGTGSPAQKQDTGAKALGRKNQGRRAKTPPKPSVAKKEPEVRRKSVLKTVGDTVKRVLGGL